MRQRPALIVVDVQRDFCPGGALPVSKGDEVIDLQNAAMNFNRRATSRRKGITKFIEIKGTHAKPIVTEEVWQQLVAFIKSVSPLD